MIGHAINPCQRDLVLYQHQKMQIISESHASTYRSLYKAESWKKWLKPFKPKYQEWYSPYLDLEYTIHICIGVKELMIKKIIPIPLSHKHHKNVLYMYIYCIHI